MSNDDPELEDCIENESDERQKTHVGDLEIVTPSAWSGGYYVAAEVRCPCGETLFLSDPLDNFCDGCGACYNMSGQRVIPSDEWRPDVGECDLEDEYDLDDWYNPLAYWSPTA